MPGPAGPAVASSTRPLPVLLVVDTGVDDALALVVAVRHPRLRLVGVVATAGNVPLPQAVANTRLVLDLLGSPVPLARGTACRSDGALFPARPGHGPDGLAGAGPPPMAEVDLAALVPAAALGPALGPAGVVVSLGPLTPVRDLTRNPVLAVAAWPGAANAAMDPAAAADVRARARVIDDDPWEFAAPLPPGYLDAVPAGEGVRELARHLLAHQQRRGAGLGDAGAVLRLAGSTSPAADLRGLLALGP
jgi:hypothetical protein